MSSTITRVKTALLHLFAHPDVTNPAAYCYCAECGRFDFSVNHMLCLRMHMFRPSETYHRPIRYIVEKIEVGAPLTVTDIDLLRVAIGLGEHERKAWDSHPRQTVLEVRLRDGDKCRWCGVFCQPLGRTSARSLTIDYLTPITAGGRGTVDNMVVSCHSCRSSRREDIEEWAAQHLLLPIPESPEYGRPTARLLSQHGFDVSPTYGPGSVGVMA